MKTFLFLILFFISFCSSAQFRYLAVVKDIETQDSAKHVCVLFEDMRGKCKFDEKSQTFIIHTKTMLPRVVVEDYLIGNGYTLVTFFLDEDSSQIFIKRGMKEQPYYKKYDLTKEKTR